MTTAHFVANWSRGEGSRRRLITSANIDKRIIALLATATGDICPVSEDRVDVTLMNRVYQSIVRLEDDVESAWPDADGCRWLTNKLKVVFSFLHIFSQGAATYPEYVGAIAQGSTTTGLFQCAIIVNSADRLAINSKEGIKLVATVLYYKHEVNLKDMIDTPQRIPASVCVDASGYADVIYNMEYTWWKKWQVGAADDYDSVAASPGQYGA